MASPVAKQVTAASGFVMACGRSNSQAATSITVTDFASQRVFQRVVGAKSITVSGTYVGSPSVIEARVVDYTSGNSITAWSPIATYPASGVYSGTLRVPQGGWYRLQVRDGVNNAITAQGSNKFGVGIILGLAGQSNMANFQTTPMSGGYPSGGLTSIEYESSTFRRLGNTADAYPANTLTSGAGGYGANYTNTGQSNGDGYVFLANLLSIGTGVPVCVVERAAGGSLISSWLTGQANWNTFSSALTAIGGDCEIVIWLQGESDADAMSTSTMVTRLGTLHNQLKTLTGRDNNTLHFGVISLGIGTYLAASEGEFGNMRAAHVQFGNTTAGSFYVTGAHDTFTGDGVHITGAGFNVLGRRYAKSALAHLGIGSPCSGPKIISASRSGTTVTALVQHTGGTAITDGAGGNGSSLTGFQFFDAGNGGAQINYTTSIVSDTIVFTLASEPLGVLTMSYAMMNNPHSVNSQTAPVVASIVYDNSTYLNSTVGSPLQPLAAITVT